ncbi:hypothetical protein MHU86_2479 [Fragilaria crotonensis]|nr:hypothetical protein MHU86_2479 [Fragilaria crotonensis]
MNPQTVSCYPNLELSSVIRQPLKYGTNDEKHQIDSSPSPRYQRRSSVTRYSLDQMTTEPREALRKTKKQDTFEMPEHYSSYETTKSADPVTIRIPEGADSTTITEDQPPVEPPRGRYRRRCSVTKYCLEDAQTASTLVKVTVEEPFDTVESIEHRKMLANDTIESAGAGDLIVGWNQAGADFLENDDDCTIGGLDDGTVCDADIHQRGKDPTIPEKGSYFRAVLSQTFPIAKHWFNALRSETMTTSEAGDARSSRGQGTAPTETQ